MKVDLISHLEEIHQLMTLQGENPFKIRAFEKAIKNLAGQTDLKERANEGTLIELDGIGKGIAEVITEYFKRGSSKVHDELSRLIPPELIELTRMFSLAVQGGKLVSWKAPRTVKVFWRFRG